MTTNRYKQYIIDPVERRFYPARESGAPFHKQHAKSCGGVPNPPGIIRPARDEIISESRPQITGTADPGNTVFICVNQSYVYTIPDESGNWETLSPAALDDGAYSVYAIQINRHGFSGRPAIVTFTVALDARPCPPVPLDAGQKEIPAPKAGVPEGSFTPEPLKINEPKAASPGAGQVQTAKAERPGAGERAVLSRPPSRGGQPEGGGTLSGAPPEPPPDKSPGTREETGLHGRGLLCYRKWWEYVEVDLAVNGDLLTGIPIFTDENTLRVVNDAYSYFVPLEKIDYIRTTDGLKACEPCRRLKFASVEYC